MIDNEALMRHDVSHVVRWISPTRSVVYVFLGRMYRRHPRGKSVRDGLMAGGRTPPPKHLADVFGKKYETLLAIKSPSVQYIDDIISEKNTLLHVRHKVATVCKCGIRDLYMWRKLELLDHQLTQDAQGLFVDALLEEIFYPGRITCTRADIAVQSGLLMDGAVSEAGSKHNVTLTQARRILSKVKIDRTTLPLGFVYLGNNRKGRQSAQQRVRFSYDPTQVSVAASPNEAIPVYEDQVRLGEYFHDDDTGAVPLRFDIIVRQDAERVITKGDPSTYFPFPPSPDAYALSVEDDTSTLTVSTTPTTVHYISLRSTVSHSESNHCDIDLISTFTRMKTSMDLPIVKINEVDNGAAVFKVSRTAVHRQTIGPVWIATWIKDSNRVKAKTSEIQLGVRHPDYDELYGRVTIHADGRVYASCTFPGTSIGTGTDISAFLESVNRIIVKSVEDGKRSCISPFDTTLYTPTPLFSSMARSHVFIRSTLTSQMTSRKIVLFSTTHVHPSLREIAHHVRSRGGTSSIFSLAEQVVSGEVRLYVLRGLGANRSVLPYWVLARNLLKQQGATEDADLERRLSDIFLVPLEETRRTLVSITNNDVMRVTGRPHLVHAPCVVVRIVGHSGYMLQTHHLYEYETVHDVFREFKDGLLPQIATTKSSSSGTVAALDNPTTTKMKTGEDDGVTDNNEEDVDENAVLALEDEDDGNAGNDGNAENDGDPLLNSHIQELMNEEKREIEAHKQENEEEKGLEHENDEPPTITNMVGHKPATDVLKSLQIADPRLFTPKSNYAKMCQKVSSRQPVPIPFEELHKIDPASHTGAIRYGSDPHLAQKNAYICPEVWCPISRVPYTDEQYVKRGKTCPLPEEKAIEMSNNSYWNGDKRYPGFMSSWKHPDGMCMPCCFRNPRPTCDSPRFDGRPPPSAGVSPVILSEDADDDGKTDVEHKYIKRDNAVPLIDGRYGMLSKVMQAVFHTHHQSSSSSSRSKHRPASLSKSRKKRQAPGKCGIRADGSGQFDKDTLCYVRKGIPQHNQGFLQAVGTLLPDDVKSSWGGTTDGLVGHICQHISLLEYITMGGGEVCRMFMNIDSSTLSTSASGSDKKNSDLYEEFVSEFLKAPEYHSVTGTKRLREVLKKDRHSSAARTDPSLMREFHIFVSLHNFKAYLRDEHIVKSHRMLIDLFNLELPWLNRRGGPIIVVLEVVDEESMSILCDGVHRAMSSRDLASGVSFIFHTGKHYEPVVLVEPYDRRELRGVTESRRKAGLVHHKTKGVKETAVFDYNTNQEVRSLLDTIIARCDGGGQGGRHRTAAGLYSALRAYGTKISAQVLDYGFRVAGFVTSSEIFVPMPITASSSRDSMLISPYQVTYLADITDLRPKTSATKLAQFFTDLAEVLDEPTYAPGGWTDDALVLASGAIVPYKMTSPPTAYLDNLNILVGKRLPDPRTERASAEKRSKKVRDDLDKLLRKTLQQDAESLQEYAFQRSAFNPFPLWYRRKAMCVLVRRLLGGAVVFDDIDIDRFLLLGGSTAVLGPRTTQDHKGRLKELRDLGQQQHNLHDVVITDADIASGEWVEFVKSVSHNPYARLNRANEQRRRRTDSMARSDSVPPKIIAQGSLLTSICEGVKSPNAATTMSNTKTSTRSRLSSSGKRTAAGPFVDIVAHCDIWKYLAVLGMLVLPGGDYLSVKLMGRIVANTVIEQTATKYHTADDTRKLLTGLVGQHPTLSRIWSSSLSSKQQQQLHWPPSFVDKAISAIGGGSDYSPGLLDVYAVSRFLNVEVRVYVVKNKEDLPFTLRSPIVRKGIDTSELNKIPCLTFAHDDGDSMDDAARTKRVSRVLYYKQDASLHVLDPILS